jgi:hypothetical protein
MTLTRDLHEDAASFESATPLVSLGDRLLEDDR